MTPGPTPRAEERWVVFNCPVTVVLGRYGAEEEAVKAAADAGHCSFAYELTADEAEALRRAGE